MAEAMNYRMNLVIDPKNVIKANRELRAMERYFERIQGRVMRIGRTRMAPEIVLKDSASKGLDNLLAKMQRVKSQVIQASANVKLNVQKQVDTNLNLSVQKQIEASVQVDLRAAGLDFSPLTDALTANTTAVDKLTAALGTLQLGGGGSGKKSGLDTAIGILGTVTTIGATMRSGGQLKDKSQKMREAWSKDKSTDNKPAEVNKNRRVGSRSRGRQENQNTVAAPKTEQTDKPLTKWGKAFNRAEKTGDFIETLGTFGKGSLESIKGVLDLTKGMFGGGASGIVSGGAASSAKTAAGSDAVKQAADGSTGASAVKNAGKSGLGSGLLKGLGKRALGPLGYIADATAIATAKPGKERNQAIGSIVGGGIGSTIGGIVGSVIPVAGTMIGSTLGGTVGSFIGEKVGGAISGIGDKFKEGKEKVSKWFSNTFSFGKKDKEAAQPKDVPKVPPSSAAALPAPIIPKPAAADFSKPLLPNPALSPYGPYVPPSHTASMSTLGPPASAAQNQAFAGKPTSPQSVQISPEQMSTISGLLMDFKTETTVNYNLPPGAVQVTVHEEHPIDVEGLILQIGQRLRAEFSKAAQNRKPTPMAY
jgi:hypothetical protein